MDQACSANSLSAIERHGFRRLVTAMAVPCVPGSDRLTQRVHGVPNLDLGLHPLAEVVGPEVDGQHERVRGVPTTGQAQPLERLVARLLSHRPHREPHARDAGDSRYHRSNGRNEVVRQPTRHLHFSSPVLSNSRTVEATGGGVNPSPRASAGASPLTVTPDD